MSINIFLGLSAASDDQKLTRDFQSLPYDFATSVMIQQKQSHTEVTNIDKLKYTSL